MPAELVAVLAKSGVTAPFPIQALTLVESLAGRDVLGRGRTGSGKTLAFALPVVAALAGGRSRPGAPRALILAPTRELAAQITQVISPLAAAFHLRCTAIFGGVKPGPQLAALRSGVDIVVACPGRLLDHHRAGALKLNAVRVVVVDEADHMADQGFLPSLRRILQAAPEDAQQLWFSATLDKDVAGLVAQHMRNPVTRTVAELEPSAAAGVASHLVLHVPEEDRVAIVAQLAAGARRCLVFCRTKSRARRLCRQLRNLGLSSVELHGDLAQGVRARNLAAFASGDAPVLVATDIAARGIHVDDVDFVVHADPPVEHKAYVHRSGRTARAGASGAVVTLAGPDQAAHVAGLLRKAGVRARAERVTAQTALAGLMGFEPRQALRPAPPAAEKQAVTAAAAQPGPQRSRGHQRPNRPSAGAPERDRETAARRTRRRRSRA
ncbi:MAG: DEAD/DEAH box helicase [Acidimicrobiales bacterium]